MIQDLDAALPVGVVVSAVVVAALFVAVVLFAAFADSASTVVAGK